MLNQRNSTAQGTVGMAAAIALYSARGDTVSLPLVDEQPYDLLVHVRRSDRIIRVQVKTTRNFRSGAFIVHLAGTEKPFNRLEVDELFILTKIGDIYIIPPESVGGSRQIRLGDKYNDFYVASYRAPFKDKGNTRLNQQTIIQALFEG